jgi:hypothetical protein
MDEYATGEAERGLLEEAPLHESRGLIRSPGEVGKLVRGALESATHFNIYQALKLRATTRLDNGYSNVSCDQIKHWPHKKIQ